MNSMYFRREQVEAGEMRTFIDTLLNQCYGAGDLYNDIHIKPEDCGAFVVEWVQLPWSHDYGGEFKYLEEDKVIFTEYHLPDGSFIYLETEDDFNQYLENWFEDNPGWVKNEYGLWINKDLNEMYEEVLKNPKAKPLPEEVIK